MLGDWAIPGEHAASAALDVARTICRRAERRVVELAESGPEVGAELLVYLNRLSDLLWILGRQIEVEAGVDATLRTPAAGGRSGRVRGERMRQGLRRVRSGRLRAALEVAACLLLLVAAWRATAGTGAGWSLAEQSAAPAAAGFPRIVRDYGSATPSGWPGRRPGSPRRRW